MLWMPSVFIDERLIFRCNNLRQSKCSTFQMDREVKPTHFVINILANKDIEGLKPSNFIPCLGRGTGPIGDRGIRRLVNAAEAIDDTDYRGQCG